jgi:hypothetical protein
MREPGPSLGLYGLMAEFDRPERLLEAVGKARDAGFTCIEAFSPFPVDGVAEALGFRDRRVALATLLGGIAGAAIAYGMQVYVNLDFPLNIGGRALVAPPAFALITFELLVLFAVSAGIGTMFWLNGLPRLHHPVFGVESFHLASSDKFFLAILANDPKFEPRATRRFLQRLKPLRIDEAPFAEQPE